MIPISVKVGNAQTTPISTTPKNNISIMAKQKVLTSNGPGTLSTPTTQSINSDSGNNSLSNKPSPSSTPFQGFAMMTHHPGSVPQPPLPSFPFVPTFPLMHTSVLPPNPYSMPPMMPLFNGPPILPNNNIKPKKKVKKSGTKRRSPSSAGPQDKIHSHIISYLNEIGLSESAKALQRDLVSSLLSSASPESMQRLVKNLNEVDTSSLAQPTLTSPQTSDSSNSSPPPNKKKTSTTEGTSFNADEVQILKDKTFFNDVSVVLATDSTTPRHIENDFEPSADDFLNILHQSTKPLQQTTVAPYVEERLTNLEKTLSIKSAKDTVFSRLKEVEERVLQIEGSLTENNHVTSESITNHSMDAIFQEPKEVSDYFFQSDELVLENLQGEGYGWLDDKMTDHEFNPLLKSDNFDDFLQ